MRGRTGEMPTREYQMIDYHTYEAIGKREAQYGV